MLSCEPSTQNIKNNMRNNKLENVVTDVCLDSEQRHVCSLPFEEYINFWMEMATTNPEVLMTRETLDKLMRYTEKFAAPSGTEAHDLIQAQRTCNTPVQKLHSKNKRKQKRRVETMKRLYMQCKAPELLTPKIPVSADPDELDHWEKEMDELVEWTHSLSFKEIDDL